MMTTIDGTTYLAVRRNPRWPYSLQVVKATDKRPKVIPSGSVLVKLRLQMPAAAFTPLEPEAVVVIPDALVQLPVEVEAVASDG